jgi:hypothetical protein
MPSQIEVRFCFNFRQTTRQARLERSLGMIRSKESGIPGEEMTAIHAPILEMFHTVQLMPAAPLNSMMAFIKTRCRGLALLWRKALKMTFWRLALEMTSWLIALKNNPKSFGLNWQIKPLFNLNCASSFTR